MIKKEHLKKIMRKILSLLFFLLVLLWFLVLFGLTSDTEIKKLGYGFSYASEHKDITGFYLPHKSKTSQPVRSVPPIILSYAYDDQFIIAKQKPAEYDNVMYEFNGKWNDYFLGRDTVYYWLIIKKEHKVLGPLDYDKFNELRIDYDVPKKLILK